VNVRPIAAYQQTQKVNYAAWPMSSWPHDTSSHSFKWPKWTLAM